jgi:hypothetical protein
MNRRLFGRSAAHLETNKKRICGSRTALWRFLARHDITVKKACARRNSSAPTSLGHVDAAAQLRLYI